MPRTHAIWRVQRQRLRLRDGLGVETELLAQGATGRLCAHEGSTILLLQMQWTARRGLVQICATAIIGQCGRVWRWVDSLRVDVGYWVKALLVGG